MIRFALLTRQRGPAGMRGSIILPAAVAVVVSLVLLASADVGYLFYLKRELQKSADMAAVAGAQRIEVGDLGPVCSQAVTDAAEDVARRNLDPAGVADETVTLRCGQWDREGAGLVPPDELGDPGAPDEWRWRSAGTAVNAVWVRLDLAAPRLMPFVPLSRNVMAHAVAMQDAPVAAFSVGMTIASLKPNSPLPVLLRELGVDVPRGDILGPSGIASLAAVLNVAGIPVSADLTAGQVDALLKAKTVTVGQLLDATLAVAEQNSVARAGLDVLNSLRGLPIANAPGLRVGDLAINLLGENGHGLLNLVGGGQLSGSALFTNVNLGELMATAITVAAYNAPATIFRTPSALATDLGFLGTLNTQIKVIEPPAIGIGSVGATAHNAQVRAFVHVDTSKIIPPTLVSLNLPLHLEVGGAHAQISDIDCSVDPPRVDFQVEPALLRACVTTIPESEHFSRAWACPALAAHQGPTVLSVLTIPVLRQGDFPPVSVLSSPKRLTFETRREDLPASGFVTLDIDLGSTIQSVLGNVWKGVHSIFSPGGVDGSGVDQAALSLAKDYLDASRNAQGAYDLERTITTLTQGRGTFEAVGRWTAKQAVPRACGFLLLDTCWEDGDVWEGFRRSVTGQGQGIVGGLLGTLLGGLVLDNCYGLLSLRREACMQRNLASYMQTRPNGFAEAAPQTGRWTPETCGNSLLCRLLSGVVAPLVAPLDMLGSALTSLTSGVVGVDLGRTEVQLMSLSCQNARLVY